MHNSRQSLGSNFSASSSRTDTQSSLQSRETKAYLNRQRTSETAVDLLLCSAGLIGSGLLFGTGAGSTIGVFAFAMQIAKCEYDLAINLMPDSEARDQAKRMGELVSAAGLISSIPSTLYFNGDPEKIADSAAIANIIQNAASMRSDATKMWTSPNYSSAFSFSASAYATADGVRKLDGSSVFSHDSRNRDGARELPNERGYRDSPFIGSDPRDILDHIDSADGDWLDA